MTARKGFLFAGAVVAAAGFGGVALMDARREALRRMQVRVFMEGLAALVASACCAPAPFADPHYEPDA
jgi:hypothetical protein